jgi:hypothetical protein
MKWTKVFQECVYAMELPNAAPLIKVSDVDDVPTRSRFYGFADVHGLSFLPSGFFEATTISDLLHEPTSAVLGPLFHRAGIAFEYVAPSLPFRSDFSSHWTGPILYFPATVYAEAPGLTRVILRFVSDYLGALFGKGKGYGLVRLTLVVASTTRTVRVEYEGPPNSITTMDDALKDALPSS